MRSVERNGWKDCVNCILDKLLSISMFEKWMDPSSMKFFSFFKSINSCRFRYFFLFLFRGNDRSIFVVRFLAPNLGEKKLHRVKWICIKFHESWNPVIVRMSMNCKFIQWIRLPRRQPTQTKHYFNNFSYLSREISDSWGLSWYGIFRRLIILSCSIQFRFTVVQNFKFITLVRYLGTSLLSFFYLKFNVHHARYHSMWKMSRDEALSRNLLLEEISRKRTLFDICYYFIFIIPRKNSRRISNYDGTSKLGYSQNKCVCVIWIYISYFISIFENHI